LKRIDGKSLKSLITNQKDHSLLYPKYIVSLQKLVSTFDIEIDDNFAKLVNFKKNKSYPKHNWFDYKHGYSEDLVKNVIRTSGVTSRDLIMDPFCGVGTTNVVAQSMGIRSIGFDISPVALLAARTKTYCYSVEDKQDIINIAKAMKKSQKAATPDSALIKSAYHPDVMDSLNTLFGNILTITNTPRREFLMLAYLAIVESSSNRRKDGNGLKTAFKPPKFLDTNGDFLAHVERMIEDLEHSNYETEAEITDGSFLDADIEHLKNKVALTIFSPPYANCFDYFEVYKLEMWMGRFVKSNADFSPYRSKALRSHVNSSFSHSIRNFNADVDLIASLLSCYNLWNKNIPYMIRGYFDDMTKLLKNIYYVSKPGAEVHIIVANSGYKGILVPTDLLLADIAVQIGYECIKIVYARKIRSSSQQMQFIQDKYKNLMRESIVVLRKPTYE
jgi:DNA modification methylase